MTVLIRDCLYSQIMFVRDCSRLTYAFVQITAKYLQQFIYSSKAVISLHQPRYVNVLFQTMCCDSKLPHCSIRYWEYAAVNHSTQHPHTLIQVKHHWKVLGVTDWKKRWCALKFDVIPNEHIHDPPYSLLQWQCKSMVLLITIKVTIILEQAAWSQLRLLKHLSFRGPRANSFRYSM